ncbi:MAG TPA: class I SAM-dependent methyltransferase, partial [Gammaproteobacteria bacterium]|nr:class I SAM-dependent methyltransferase [Gammaproteobacteria bacterium]
MQEPIALADNWDNHWQELSKDIYFNTPAVQYRWKCMEKLLDLNSSTGSSTHLMDFGCGTGGILEFFFKKYQGIQIKGTDNSTVGLDIAKAKMPLGDFFQADLCSENMALTPEQTGWATHATCSEVLEHLDEPVALLKNVSQFLRKGATLVISVPGGPMSEFDKHVGHRKHYTAKLLEAELNQAGYKVDKIACAGF